MRVSSVGIITNVMFGELPAGDKRKLLPFFGGILLMVAAAILMRSVPRAAP